MCQQSATSGSFVTGCKKDIVTCCKAGLWFFVNLLKKKKLAMYNLSVACVLLDSGEFGLAHLTNTGNVVCVLVGSKKLGHQSKQERNL